MEQETMDWEKRFDENIPKMKDDESGPDRVGNTYDFGYKYTENYNIHTVTDWGNIKKFIHSELQKQREGIEKKIIALRKAPDEYDRGEPYKFRFLMIGRRDAIDDILSALKN